ncbi:sulfite exporter TauE/SafE family protein [Reinekea sp.]|jgi:sulfite exporter TauE/SafE|uniref:sulfite exporter TauE/SafE family protein n=1 Tax=Reinekea sp. TaxID=1970455 RepID=UPI002A818FEE|nr:sulfite exporter TauE/SafE family protein [Reinekea sp.]
MTDLLAAFLIGLVSAGHCLGMCGGLMVAAGLNSTRPILTAYYNIGRITTYVVLASVLSYFSHLLPSHTLPWLQILSGCLLLLSALYFLGWNHWLKKFEQVGVPLWRRLQPLSKKLLPIDSAKTAYCIGLLWGFIPCGLIYTAIAFSLGMANVLHSALAMLCFGLGTLPAMIGSALMANRIRPWLYHPKVKFILAALMLLFALTIWLDAYQNLR